MNRRKWIKQALTVPLVRLSAGGEMLPDAQSSAGSGRIQIYGASDTFWTLTDGPAQIAVGSPSLNIDGQRLSAVLRDLRRTGEPRRLGSGTIEERFRGGFGSAPSASLELVYQTSVDSPIARFRYILHAEPGAVLSGDGSEIGYFTVSFAGFDHCVEIQLANFNGMLHSYTPVELPIDTSAFENRTSVVGPLLIACGKDGTSLLLAYEHGAQAPDSFLDYSLAPGREVTLRGSKANYFAGQRANGFETVWMHVAAIRGGIDEAARAYREFVLKYLSANAETRRPHIFYNTWNFQERNKWVHNKSYLESMNPDRILAEIDVAHRMGIDSFVLDTGWYEKTGDWQVSESRFGGRFAEIQKTLDRFGMRLGLWFDPTAAARSSQMYNENRDCVRLHNGKQDPPRRIWETEESYAMCLVSPYGDAFSNALIRVAKETGARYFKWDAIAQYGCDSPHHWHGSESNSESERWNSYAFRLPLEMARIADKVAAAVPNVIIDFDITEAGRCVGLSFLSAGRYFLINNGPYLFNYDLPIDYQHQNWNLFFYPGPARTWICRSPLSYDRWLPMNLFLTHYLPDDPASSQLINMASLVLGQNGIWGDLLSVSADGVQRIGEILSLYKRVRDDVAASSPVTIGAVGGSPEIHEKISAVTGRGLVAIFATAKGRYRYITAHRPVNSVRCEGQLTAHFDARRRAVLECDFKEPGAAIAFFGV